MNLKAFALAISLAVPCLAHADMTVAQFKQGHNAPAGSPTATIFNMYLSGMAEGVQTQSVMGDQLGGKRAYCTPGTFALDADGIKHFVQQTLRADNAWQTNKHDKVLVSIVLVTALKTAYPCN